MLVNQTREALVLEAQAVEKKRQSMMAKAKHALSDPRISAAQRMQLETALKELEAVNLDMEDSDDDDEEEAAQAAALRERMEALAAEKAQLMAAKQQLEQEIRVAEDAHAADAVDQGSMESQMNDEALQTTATLNAQAAQMPRR